MKLGWFIAIVFAALLAALLVYGVQARLDRRHAIAGSKFVADAERALQEYHVDYGAFPEGDNREIAQALVEGSPTRGSSYLAGKSKDIPEPENQMLDPWRTPLRFRFVNGQPVVTSAGVDTRFDTDDDVTSAMYKTLKPYPPLPEPAPAVEKEDEEVKEPVKQD